MKNLTKRIISSMMCAAVAAVNFGAGAVIPEMSAANLTVNAADSTIDGTIFDDRSQSKLGNDEKSLAIKRADPYGTTDSNGNGTKWKALSVVPEVFGVYNCWCYLKDYTNGKVGKGGTTTTASNYTKLLAMTGINIGSGKDDTVACLAYSDKDNGVYISLCDAVNGGFKTDGNFNLSWKNAPVLGDRYGSSTSGSCTQESIKSSFHDSDYHQYLNNKVSNTYGLLKVSSLAYLADDDIQQNSSGQYLAVAAGDFDGDGTDSIIAFIPDYDTPCIKEYGYTKRNVSDFNYSYSATDTSYTYSGANYYKPYEHQTISSNVYSDFGLTKKSASSNHDKSRNLPIVDIIAEDIDRDGCDELIVTAGLGYTSEDNNCSTVMKIYDMVNGKFEQTYSKSLSGNYNGQQGRIRWASSAVGNVQTGASGELVSDFPEIVTAGWVDTKNAAGIDMKHRFGVHITEIIKREKKGNTQVGKYQEKLVMGTSDATINSTGSDGVSQYMKNGFPVGWDRHDKLAVNTVAYKGPAQQAALVLGDTVYDITSDNKLSVAHWSKDVDGHTRYAVRNLLTGNYPMAKGLAGESVYFLISDLNNTYAAFTYYYKDGSWTTSTNGTDNFHMGPATSAMALCNVDVDNDSVYVKLRDVVKTWADPKPLYVLEAAPFFREFPDSKGSTAIGFGHEEGHETKWQAGISAGIEASFEQEIAFFGVEIGGTEFGTSLTTAMTYEGSKSSSLEVTTQHGNESDKNAVLVERTPMYIYRYDVLGKDNLPDDPANIIVTGAPETAMISVEEYNGLAEEYNKTHEQKLTKIDSSFGLGTPGDPLSYRREFPDVGEQLISCSSNSETTAVNGVEGYTEKTISSSTTLNNGFSIEIASETYIGGSLFGVGSKFTWEVSAGTGASFFHTDSVTCSGAVKRQDKDSRFNFNWDVARWMMKDIPVVGYKVQVSDEMIGNIPPVMPDSLTVTGKGNNSAALKWTNPSTANGRITANYIKVYYKKDADLNYTSKMVEFKGTEGAKTWSLSGLERNTKYQCYIANVYAGNAGSLQESIQSNIVEFTTNNDKENVDVTVNTGKGLTLKSGKAIQSVDCGKEAITPVIYSVSDGYQLPKGFYLSSNGIEAQSAGVDIIKVSGTPTATATINIPDMDIINYTISYTLNNGTLDNRVTSYNVESETITLPTPAKDGYEFMGWTDTQGNKITEIKKGSTGNVTVEANWKDLSYLGYTANYPADGSEQYPYIISSAKGWNLLCDLLAEKPKGYFTNKIIKLGANITVSRMAGSDSHDFTGTFDGNGKKMTFNYTADDIRIAPFRYVQGSKDNHAVIKNLNVVSNITSTSYKHLAGLVALQTGYVDITDCNVKVNISSTADTDKALYPAGLVSQASKTENGTLTISGCKVTGNITTNGKYAGGFVGVVQGTTNIENSISSVTINSSVDIDGNKDGTHGGFVGEQQKNSGITIKGCVFNGKLLTDNGTIKCGGFVGWRNNTITIYDSIFAPAEITVGNNGSATFARNRVDTYNCYYTYLFNDGASYAPYLTNGDVTPKKYNNGQQAYTITAGDNVTIDYGTPKNTYKTSGITAYATGLAYNGKFYAGKDDEITLTLNSNTPQGYTFKEFTANAGTLTAEENAYVLTMPESNVTINAVYDLNLLENLSEISADETALGGSITIKAAAKGGTGNYTYAVYCKQKADTKWVTKQNFDSNDTVIFKPAYASDYDICVKVKDKSGTIEKKYFVLKVNEKVTNLSTLVSDNIKLGEQVTVNCLAKNGLGEYQYQVFYKQTAQSKWTVAQDFSTNATVNFTPKNAKTYDVCVKVKDATGKLDKLYFTVTVSDNRLQSTSAISAETIKAGESVTLNCSAKGGTAPYTYSVQYKQQAKTKWTTQQDFAENNIVTVKPASVTAYDICVKVQDKNGTVAKQYFTVTVTK